jgi:hypothetical protein
MLASGSLWVHILLIILISWLFIGTINGWWAAAVIGFLHLLIDLGKLLVTRWNTKHNRAHDLTLFIADQVLHVITMICVWLFIIHGWGRIKLIMPSAFPAYAILLRILGYIIVIGPAKYLVRYFFSRWSMDIETTNDGLKDAGVTIGILERILVLTLVFIGQFSAIGFLVAAKSILRLIDRPVNNEDVFSSRKHTEYVVIGTFLSFGLALVTGLLINKILGI